MAAGTCPVSLWPNAQNEENYLTETQGFHPRPAPLRIRQPKQPGDPLQVEALAVALLLLLLVLLRLFFGQRLSDLRFRILRLFSKGLPLVYSRETVLEHVCDCEDRSRSVQIETRQRRCSLLLRKAIFLQSPSDCPSARVGAGRNSPMTPIRKSSTFLRRFPSPAFASRRGCCRDCKISETAGESAVKQNGLPIV